MTLNRNGRVGQLILFLIIITIGMWGLGRPRADTGDKTVAPLKHATLHLDYSEFDFGSIIQGETASTVFVLHNAGNDVLIIEKVVSESGIVKAECSENAIQPGEQATLTVMLDTSSGINGSVQDKILLTTNNKENPVSLLRVFGKVQPILAIDPCLVFVGQVERDASYSGKVQIKGALVSQNQLKNIDIRPSTTGIKTKIVKRKSKKGDLAFLEFVLQPEFGLRAGSFHETITIISKNPPAQTAVTLVGQKLGIIEMVPDRFNFYPGDAPESYDSSVILECSKSFSITKIRDQTGQLDISIETIDKGKKYKVKATLKNHKTRSLLGVVQIYTDLEENPLLDLPVIVRLF